MCAKENNSKIKKVKAFAQKKKKKVKAWTIKQRDNAYLVNIVLQYFINYK